jgi:uncharacterized membrane protein YbhN (UPF0104 family)
MTTGVVSVGERRSHRWLLVALWVALTIALLVAIPRLPWAQAVDQLRTIQGWWLAAAVIANLMILPLWTVEWRLLIPRSFPVPFRRMFDVVSISAAVLNSVPFFAGEISAVALLVGRAGLPRSAALSVLAMDQLLVGFAKLTVIALAAWYAPLPTWLRAGVVSLVVGVSILAAVLLPLSRQLTWGVHLEALRDRNRPVLLALLALSKKGCELAAILAVQAAFGLEPSLATGLLVLAALSITTLLPVAPANLGVYEATVFAAYRFLDVPVQTALGIAIVQHLCFLVPSLLTGYAVLTLRQLRPPRSGV